MIYYYGCNLILLVILMQIIRKSSLDNTVETKANRVLV